MKSNGLEEPNPLPGHRFPSVSLGPLSEEAVLKMAELTKDFHPVRVMDRVARGAGYAGMVLHPVWISGLADVGIRTAFPLCRVSVLSLTYPTPAVHSDTLTFELTCQAHDKQTGEVKVTFQVKNLKGHPVADGWARIFLHPPQLLRNVSRETFGIV